MSKVVAIIGATGVQGNSVLKSLLDSYTIRAFTRSPEKLKDITHPNLTIAKVDISDVAAVKANLAGVWAVFLNTVSDNSKPEGTEQKQAEGVIDAAAEAGVEWLIFSSCPEGMPARVWREKANAMAYAREVAKRPGAILKNVFVEVRYTSRYTLHDVLIACCYGFLGWRVYHHVRFIPNTDTQSRNGSCGILVRDRGREDHQYVFRRTIAGCIVSVIDYALSFCSASR